MKPVKFLKKNQRYFKASSKILETMWQARQGGFISKVLAGFSATGTALDMMFPDPEPRTALIQEGLSYYETSIENFIYHLLIKESILEQLSSTAYEQAYICRKNGEAIFGFIVGYSGNYDFYVAPNKESDLFEILKSSAWKKSRELELTYVSNGRHQEGSLHLTPLSMPGPYLSKRGVDWYIERLKKYRPGPRTILLRGPSGIGKGVLARHISRGLKGDQYRTLKISAKSLKACQHQEILDIVRILQPSVLILDDLELNQEENTDSFLALFETLREPECLVIATMMIKNPTTEPKMGTYYCPGMRPGRIDETFILQLPDLEERMQILSFYAAKFCFLEMMIDVNFLKDLATKTEGLSGAYLGSLVERIHTHGIKNADYELNQVLINAPDQNESEED